MAKTKIEWTEATWNPFKGCSKVSSGCKHCYAETMANRLRGMGKAGYSDVIEDGRWTGKVNLVESVLEQPLKRKKPTMYFVNSMSDTFHESVPFEWIDKLFAVMALCPQHTFQVLTKRPDRMAEYFDAKRQAGGIGRDAYIEGEAQQMHFERTGEDSSMWLGVHFPLPNVWLGTSVENQATANERIPWLLKCPAAVRWLSMEPLLGDVLELELSSSRTIHWTVSVSGAIRNKMFGCFEHEGRSLSNQEAEERLRILEMQGVECILMGDECEGFDDKKGCPGHDTPGIDWVVVGGESGSGARPMNPDWARGIRDQCSEAKVPFFFKQWGGVNKKSTGYLLDGRLHHEFPEVKHG